MNSYKLTATLNSNINRKTIWARDESAAMFEAISVILSKAHANKQSAWAVGAIKLVDEQGKVVAEMGAK